MLWLCTKLPDWASRVRVNTSVVQNPLLNTQQAGEAQTGSKYIYAVYYYYAACAKAHACGPPHTLNPRSLVALATRGPN